MKGEGSQPRKITTVLQLRETEWSQGGREERRKEKKTKKGKEASGRRRKTWKRQDRVERAVCC